MALVSLDLVSYAHLTHNMHDPALYASLVTYELFTMKYVKYKR
jgi:hypothetical protein